MSPHRLSLLACLVMASVMTAANPLAGADGYEDLGRPMLGVVMTPPSTRDINHNNLPPDSGVVIRRVHDGSAAQNMGLQRGDVVTQINGVPIDSMGTLRDVVQSYLPGDEVHVGGLRGGEPIQRDGFLGEWLENVPFEGIDEAAERRYRDTVNRRLARQERHLEDLRQEREQLANEVAERKQRLAEQGAADPAAAAPARQGQTPRSLPAQVVSDLWGGAEDRQLSSLPNWRLRYGFAVTPQDQPSAPTSSDQGSTLHFAFAVGDELL